MQTPNYTPEQVTALKNASPVAIGQARIFAQDMGKSTKSIIAKCVSLGIYAAQPRKVSGGAKIRKADLVAAITRSTGADSLDGLEKAPAKALSNLLASLA